MGAPQRFDGFALAIFMLFSLFAVFLFRLSHGSGSEDASADLECIVVHKAVAERLAC